MVVDLSEGSEVSSYPIRYTSLEPDLDDDTCRTTELWLRQIQPGTFFMGSPSNELGRGSDETYHEVTLTKIYYIGIFECTQKQWELIMGSNPSYYAGDARPVEMVSYNMIRGTSSTAGAGWPTYGHAVDESSFMGRLQAKSGMVFDLPTEAQWEYACRAGTTTALNSGKNLKSSEQDNAMAEVGRYLYNFTDGKGGYAEDTKVGSYLPNAWGLYDMHGNVWEICLDRFGNLGTDVVVDPKGAKTGENRAFRGGAWYTPAWRCRSAYRTDIEPSIVSGAGHDHGFRIVCLPFESF